MIFILFLHVTEVFAMLLEPQTVRDRNEATFESYEGEPVFGDPQHDQYEVKDFWWDRPTAKWEPWWASKNITVTTWKMEQMFTTEDLSKIWKEGLMDRKTSIKETQDDTTTAYHEEASIHDSTTRETLSVLNTGTETPAMPTAARIFHTKVPSDEQTNPKQHESSQVPPRGRTQDYLQDLLTATSLNFVQQSAADLIALRSGAKRSSFRSNPIKMDDQRKTYDVVPFDRELYRQLRGEFPPSLQEPNLNHSRESQSPKEKSVVQKGNKSLGLHGWKLQYPGRNTAVKKSSDDVPVPKDIAVIKGDKKYIASEEKSVVLHNDPDHSQESQVFLKSKDKAVKKDDKKYIAGGNKSLGLHGSKLQYPGRNAAVKKSSDDVRVPKDLIKSYSGETLKSSEKHKPHPDSFEKLIARTFKVTAQYQTSLNNDEYYDIIHNSKFIDSQQPSYSSPSNILFQHNDFQRYPNEKLLLFTTNNDDIPQYGYVDSEPPQQMQTIIQRPKIINPHDPSSEELTVSTDTSTVYIRPTLRIDEMSIRPEDKSPFSPKTQGFTAPFPTEIKPSKQEQDLQLPDLSRQSPTPGNVRQGAIEETVSSQSIPSAITEEPSTQPVPSAITEEPSTQPVPSAITQESFITSQRNIQTPDIMPAAATAVRQTFTVPNMETTVVTTVSTTTAETTKFTLEMVPFPLPNNLPHNEIGWSDFNIGVTTTPLPPLINAFYTEGTVLTTAHPMVIEMRTEMIEQRIGYFTVFMRKFLDITAKKDEDAMFDLLKKSTKSLDRINEHDILNGLGRPMWPGLKTLLGYMQFMPIDSLQTQAMLGHMYYTTGSIFANDISMQDLNNRVNALYEIREGEQLMKTLVDFQDFPGENGHISADKVTEDIFRAMLAPWFRNKNSPAMYNVLQDLNIRFESIQKRYLGGLRRANLQNQDINWQKKPIHDSLDNGKSYVDIKSKRTEDGNNYNDTSEEIIDQFSGNKVLYNIVKQQDKKTKMKTNKIISIKDKIRYNTKHKVTKTINYYNRVHHVDTVKQKRSKKYKKKHTDHKKNMRITTYMNYEPSKEINKYISSSNNKKETRDKKLFKKSLKNDKINTNTNNKQNSKNANFYNNKQLIKRNNYDGGSESGRKILKNKEKRSNSYNKKKTTRRNRMRTRLIIASSKEKHEDSDTYDDRSKANSRKIKSPGIKETKGNKKHEIKTSKQDKKHKIKTSKQDKKHKIKTSKQDKKHKIKTSKQDLSYRTTTKRNNFDSFDDDMEPKTIGQKVFEMEDRATPNSPTRSNARFKIIKTFEDKGERHFASSSSFEVELKKKFYELQLLEKNLVNLIKNETESRIDAKKYEQQVNNSENHENVKHKLSERVLQKRLERKQNVDNTKNNAKTSKIWQNHVSSVAPLTKIKNHGNKNLLVKESIAIDFQNNTNKPVNTENEEKFRPHLKSQYILNNAASDLKEKFLDFNRDKRETKKINILRNLDKHINILRVESSYSDEEEILKSKLQDNLLHGGRNFTDTLLKNRKSNVIRDISSYSDEEDTLKKNIYKTFI